jgi:eukaryotic-like serine/threonine-protein kinase
VRKNVLAPTTRDTIVNTTPPVASGGSVLPTSFRYELLVKIASGGMASVYVARLRGVSGFSRLVAVKRAHSHISEALRASLQAEARVAGLVHHPNAVAVLDVEERDGELLLVLDYVEGVSLAELIALREQSGEGISREIIARILLDVAAGLHAVHEIRDHRGSLLSVVHRDVSPQNILIGLDGIARITDLGIAKAQALFGEKTETGFVKGKLSYMAPEYVQKQVQDRRGDLYGLGVVGWELYAGREMFPDQNPMVVMQKVANGELPALAKYATDLDPALEDAVMQLLSRNPDARPPSAEAFAETFEAKARAASTPGNTVARHTVVAACVASVAGDALARRRGVVDEASRSFNLIEQELKPSAFTDQTVVEIERPVEPLTVQPVSHAAVAIALPRFSTLRGSALFGLCAALGILAMGMTGQSRADGTLRECVRSSSVETRTVRVLEEPLELDFELLEADAPVVGAARVPRPRPPMTPAPQLAPSAKGTAKAPNLRRLVH